MQQASVRQNAKSALTACCVTVFIFLFIALAVMLRQKSEPINEELEHVTIHLNIPFFVIKGKEQAFIDECNNNFENGICETVWEGSINVDVKNTRKNFLDNVDFLHFPNSLGKVPIAQVEEYKNNVITRIYTDNIDKSAFADQRKLTKNDRCGCLKYRVDDRNITNYQEARKWQNKGYTEDFFFKQNEVCQSADGESYGYFIHCSQIYKPKECKDKLNAALKPFCTWGGPFNIIDQTKEPVCECKKYRKITTINNYQEAWHAHLQAKEYNNVPFNEWGNEFCASDNENPGFFSECYDSANKEVCESRWTIRGDQFCKWSVMDLSSMIKGIQASTTSCDKMKCDKISPTLSVQMQYDGVTSKMIPQMCFDERNDMEKEECEIKQCCQFRKCLLFFDEIGTYCSNTDVGGRPGYWCSHFANGKELPAGKGICRPKSDYHFGSPCQVSGLTKVQNSMSMDMQEKLAAWGLGVPDCPKGLHCNEKGKCDIECACYHFNLGELECSFDDKVHMYKTSVCEKINSCGFSTEKYGYGAASRFTGLLIKSTTCIYKGLLTTDKDLVLNVETDEQEWDLSYFFQILDQRNTQRLLPLELIITEVEKAFAAWKSIKDVGGAWFNLMYGILKKDEKKENEKNKDTTEKKDKDTEKEKDKSSNEKEVNKDTSKLNGYVQDLINSGIELMQEFLFCMASPTLLLDRMIKQIKVEHYYKYGFVRDFAMYTYVDSLGKYTGGVEHFIHRWWPTVSFCLVPIVKNLIVKIILRLAQGTIKKAVNPKGTNALSETVVQTIFMFAVKDEGAKEVDYVAKNSGFTNALEDADKKVKAGEVQKELKDKRITFPDGCKFCEIIMQEVKNAALFFTNVFTFVMGLMEQLKETKKDILDYIDILFLWVGYKAYCDTRMKNKEVFEAKRPTECIKFGNIDARYVKMDDNDKTNDKIKKALKDMEKLIVNFHSDQMKIQWFKL